MNKLTKILSLVLALVLLGSLMPLAAEAVVDLDPHAPRVEQIPMQINPRYRGMVSESEIDMPEFRHDPSQLDANATVTYQTIANAGAEVREYMIDRADTFVIYVKSDSSDYQGVFDAVLEVAMAHTGDPTAGDYIAWHYEATEAQASRTYLNGVYNYTFEFAVTYYTTAEQEEELTVAVNQLLRNLNLSGKSDYEKVSAVYDYMCANITYDHTSSGMLKHTAYAALVNKTAVCQGYASLYYRLLLTLGVDTRVIAGIGNGGAHGWNIVELGGLYYNLDTTWDAGADSYSYFLRNSWNFVDHYRFLDYESMDFHNAYPMAAQDYGTGTATKDPIIYIGEAGDSTEFSVARDGTLTIYGLGDTYDYSGSSYDYYGAPWQFWEENIDALVVEEGVTRLGTDLCYDMENLESVTLPETLAYIDCNAFQYCSALSEVTLPEGLVEIGEFAFYDCDKLTEIEFPSTLTSVGSNAFYDCDGLTTVSLPKSVTSMGYAAFSNCSNLKKVYLRSEVIGEEAFADCESLTNVYMYNYVKVIEPRAFRRCTALKKIEIASGVTEIGYGAFYACNNLETVYFKGDAPTVTSSIFDEVVAVAWYPDGNDTWTADAMEVCGGDITWKAQKELKITQQPEDAYAVEGGRATVTVKAQGNDLTYKWYFKDAGASKFSLTTSFTSNKYYITMSDARDGRQVYCVITDAHGKSVTTDTVTLSIITKATILTEPKDTQVKLGATAKATVEAAGNGLTYQWYVKDVDGSSFTKSSNKTATYSYKMTEAKAGRQAYCIIEDEDGNSVKTRTVTFGLAATIVTQPSNATAAEGKRATVTVKAVGDGLTYKWYFKDVGASKFSLTTSFTGNKYYITMTDARAGRQVYCVITDQYGNKVTTKTVTLDYPAAVAITAQPKDTQVKLGATAKATVTATGDGLTYQWYVKDVGGSSFTKSSNTTATYSYKMTAAKAGRQAYCIITDSAGNKVQTRTVTFGLKVTLVAQPEDVTVASGEKATIKLNVVGDGLTYKWYFANAGATKFSLTDSFTGSKYEVTMTAARDGRRVYCVITDQYGNSVTTDTVTLSME